MSSPRRSAARLVLAACVLSSSVIIGLSPASRAATTATFAPERAAHAVVLTGLQIPKWSRLPAVGRSKPWPSGALGVVRDAHNGKITVPPDVRRGVDPSRVAAYRWEGRWVEVPVQVDERYPYFLANTNSDFAIYSATDQELTYAWDVEAWRKTAGECMASYPDGVGATPDPVPTLDDDDEIAFMASDAGAAAPTGATGPARTDGTRVEIKVVDPLAPKAQHYVYLFLRNGGSSFTGANGYVDYARDASADEWIDRHSFTDGSTEALGISNGGYGPNLSGTVCDPDGTVRESTDRFPRDGVTVSTDAYRWRATGRWMVREMHVAAPGQPGTYQRDLIDRWKGRAFQQSPDSSISLVGFEDEQVNWEANSALLGERRGPVRAIREIWGADSGTNVTKTETFYRDAVMYRYHVRVHPVPPDGLYTSWDYNAGVATRYYNALKPEGVAIDGSNDDVFNIDGTSDTPFFLDLPDPTFDVILPILKWEQVSGAGDTGSLVYVSETKGATSLTNPIVAPYYRDDACFDDGTGDDPVARPWPGEAQADPRVQAAYAGKPCTGRQGAWGSHGVHYLFLGDSDNGFVSPVPIDEVDAQQWQFAVPTATPHAVGEPYANVVRVPLVAVGTTQPNVPAPA